MQDFSAAETDHRASLVGTRIRQRRVAVGLKQAHLAREVGISAAYLNLIEHNRRRIGGKVLIDIAAALDVELAQLAEGADLGLLTDLQAAAAVAEIEVDGDTAQEFAGRFGEWAGVVAEQHRKITQLENTVAALSDRMAHDPFLSESLHEMLSSVTSIRSSAGILVGPDPVEPVWQDRFHKNMMADAMRLAEAAQSLVTYLDAPVSDAEQRSLTAQEELEAYLNGQGFDLPAVEQGAAPSGFDGTAQGEALVARYVDGLRADAARLPRQEMLDGIASLGDDPLPLSLGLGVPMDLIMRRMAQVPLPGGPVGLVICDASGTMTFRRVLDDFPLPRFGDACALWPLFAALSRPMVPIASHLRSLGAKGDMVRAYAIATPVKAAGYGQTPHHQATMLLLPSDPAITIPDTEIEEVGVSCRVCPKSDCGLRREPSILSDGF